MNVLSKNTIMRLKSFCLAALLIAVSVNSIAQEAERNTAFANYHRYYNDGQKVKNAEKEKSVRNYREYFSTQAYRLSSLSSTKKSGQEYLSLLTDDGRFSDLMQQEQRIYDQKLLQTTYSSTNNDVALFLTEAYNRIWKIAEAYRKGELSKKDALCDKYLKAIILYGNIETGRPNNNTATRFHASCFAIPTAAVNTYFAFLKQMDDVEAGKNKNALLKDACDMLKTVALQAWTQPFRNDETDNNVVQIERFRNHVWWVGGNALAYRSLLPVAFMYKSIPMVDVLSEVCQRGISMTSQNTFNKTFWTEGFTVDGAGWGHGKQCLVWGYPIDGTSNALAILSTLKGSPWAKQLTRENVDALLNFFRGSNWYYYKGYNLPCLDRSSMQYDVESKPIRYSGMMKSLLTDWQDSFTPEEQVELMQLTQESSVNDINMTNYKDGSYSGTRWFFNNDDLIRKNGNYHILVNMASVRCDGIESATNFADEYNFFTADGMTFFQKKGDEYRKIMGGWDVTASPGVTAREGMEKLTPVTNWRGYCSKYNFAGAATHGGDNAVAGFIFEKMNASDKKDVNDNGTNAGKNPTLYGVKAYKSYFMLGDYFVALGAGVTNLHPEMEGTIHTTIDQTVKENEVFVIQNGTVHPTTEGVQSFIKNGKPVWVAQKNKFAYTILPEYTQNASFICESRKADWVKMNNANEKMKKLPVTTDILRLWVDHGPKVNNGTYGYVVYAGKDIPAQAMPFTVLRNDTLIQAVRSANQNVTEVVFYQANTLLTAKDISLTASAPCVVLLEDRGNEYAISVTDPTMNASLKQIVLTFGGKKINVDMPQGEYCGKPASIKMPK